MRMKFKLPALSSLLWSGALFVAFSLLVAGCEPGGLSEGDESQTPISMAELNGIEPETESPPADLEAMARAAWTWAREFHTRERFRREYRAFVRELDSCRKKG
jgi:hypothetical protein